MIGEQPKTMKRHPAADNKSEPDGVICYFTKSMEPSSLFHPRVDDDLHAFTGHVGLHGLLCLLQQEAMAEKKRQDELVERQRKIRQLKATGIQEKHLLEWNFAVAEDNKDIQMAKRYVEQWKKVKAENLGLLLWGLPLPSCPGTT